MGTKRYARLDGLTPCNWDVLMDEFKMWLHKQGTVTHDGDALTTSDAEDLLLALFARWAARRYELPVRKS